ncbi:MAG TPA: acetate--CoA ligase family protein [Candidatus Limnocylindrales bacterium]|nr:acetate--CoA ligase family protein [Candidatus Limnocylindrales bacterium]
MQQSGNLDMLFAPKSVAVIGASNRQGSVGRAVFTNILLNEYRGTVYPVNPKDRSISGVRSYPSVQDLPESVDVAVIVVPAAVVPDVTEDCGKRGVKGLIVISAGFKEIGQDGAALERQVASLAQKYSMRMVGPNCLGAINTDPEVRLNASFASQMPLEGSIAFASQSGALGEAVIDYAAGEGIGFSKFISVGNKADVNENDVLEYLRADPKTKVILLYIEDIVDGRKFVDTVSKVTEEKPIIAVKAGVSPEGAKAASSHTGALAGSDEAYNAILKQSGVLRVESIIDLFDYARAFAKQPPPRGNRVAIITNGGGPGIMATDASVRYGLQISQFSETTKSKLRAGLPKEASVNNPIDLIGDAQSDRYELALQALYDESVDCGLVLLTPQAMVDLKKVAETIASVGPRSGKTILASILGLTDITPAIDVLESNNIPHYTFPESAVRALAAMYEYQCWVERPRTEIRHFDVDVGKAREIISNAKRAGLTNIPQDDALRILSTYGLPVIKTETASSKAEALEAAKRIGYPVAMKIVSPDVVHKIDVGGVKLDLSSDQDVSEAFDEILKNVNARVPDARIEGVILQEYVTGGTETIIGIHRDPKFGPLLMFGLGGIYVEAYRDVSFRLAPIRELSADNMINQIRGSKILQGFRGQPPADTKSIAECIERLSQLSIELPDIAELDVNPLVAFANGCRALDARIIVAKH